MAVMTDVAPDLEPDQDPREAIIAYLPELRAFAMSLTRDTHSADDLVQDTVVKAWTNFDKFTQSTNLRAWLFTILRNTFFSDRRRGKRELGDPDGVFAAQLSVRPDHDGHLAMTDFRAAFDQLSAEHREVLVLVGASGFSCEDAAAMIGVAPGTVKSRTNRARARLAEILGLDAGDSLVDVAGQSWDVQRKVW